MSEKKGAKKKLTREEQRELDVKIGFMEGVVKRDPKYVEALQILGDDYTRRGKFDAGLKMVDEQLSQLRPGDPLVQYNLACSYSLTGNFKPGGGGAANGRSTRVIAISNGWGRIRTWPICGNICSTKSSAQKSAKLKPRRTESFCRAPFSSNANVTINGRKQHYRTVAFDAAKNSVLLIEQRLLPHEFKIVGTKDYRETAAAIKDMIVRGAGAIGALALAAYSFGAGSTGIFRGSRLAKDFLRRHVETSRGQDAESRAAHGGGSHQRHERSPARDGGGDDGRGATTARPGGSGSDSRMTTHSIVKRSANTVQKLIRSVV